MLRYLHICEYEHIFNHRWKASRVKEHWLKERIIHSVKYQGQQSSGRISNQNGISSIADITHEILDRSRVDMVEAGRRWKPNKPDRAEGTQSSAL